MGAWRYLQVAGVTAQPSGLQEHLKASACCAAVDWPRLLDGTANAVEGGLKELRHPSLIESY